MEGERGEGKGREGGGEEREGTGGKVREGKIEGREGQPAVYFTLPDLKSFTFPACACCSLWIH